WLSRGCFFFSSRRRHTRSKRDWSSDVCSSDLLHFGGLPTPEGLPTIEFAQEAQADQESLARTAGLLRSAQAASTETVVRLVNPDADEDWIRAEVKRIRGDNGSEVESPTLGLGRWGQ